MNLYQPTITGSLSVSGSVNISGSITIAGGGTISGTASLATNAITASSADNFLVRNTLTAQTLVVQTITSSVDFVTGSTRFGSISANTHVFTGSMYVTGAFYVTTGSVGIGTTSPSQKLQVDGRVRVSDSSGNGGDMAVNDSGLAFSSIGAAPIEFFTSNYSTERMRIAANGNVGIGITSPNGNLQFATATNTRKIVLFEGGNNNYQFYGFGVENNALIYSTNSTSDDHVFVAAASSTTRNELMRIKGNGIVTKPYQPYFKYGIGYTGTITTEIKFGTDNGFTVYTDRDAVDSSYFNKATGNFTAPVAGVYVFGCTIMRNGSAGTGPIDFNITKNGVRTNVYGRGYAGSYNAAYEQFTIVVPIKLAASDTVALSMSGNMTVYNDDSWFYGYLLG